MRMQTQQKVRRWRRWFGRQLADPAIRLPLELAAGFLGGFCLSAAGLRGFCQPFCLGAICGGLPGWIAAGFAVGGGLGYWAFWGQAGIQGLCWIALGLPLGLLAAKKQGLLLPSLAALTVAATGLAFQVWLQENISVTVYILRITLAFGATCLAQLVGQQEDGAKSVAVGVGVLALAQISPLPFLNLGMIAAGWISRKASFATAALAGVALDLTGVTAVPMTAVTCGAYLLEKKLPAKWGALIPPAVYAAGMVLLRQYGWQPLPALGIGAMAARIFPAGREDEKSRTAEAYVQGRLEAVAAVLAQGYRLLQETPAHSVDEGALLQCCAQRACDDCDHRPQCQAAHRIALLPQTLLHQAEVDRDILPPQCKRKERLQLQLQRGQEMYRLLCADHQRQQEYRLALEQQYGFLSDYLKNLADDLPARHETPSVRFRPDVAVCARGRDATNGDRCVHFMGRSGRYYVLLCDGMGTGIGAAYEARTTAVMLRRLLVAGYPAEKALQSINSLCVLRQSAGAVTMDLAEVDLQTGRATLYKWGAAPSWLLLPDAVEQIGRACLPPGLSVGDEQASVDRVSLQNGTALVMLSDGVATDALAELEEEYNQPVGFLAALILEQGQADVPDDATAVVLRLQRME